MRAMNITIGGKVLPMRDVRPPRWVSHKPSRRIDFERLRKKQVETLERFVEVEAAGNWAEMHRMHFDWWMFPIDDGSKPEFNLHSEADVKLLRSHPDWRADYRKSVQLVAKGWGWDVSGNEQGQLIHVDSCDSASRGMGWTGWDVRLAKVMRSLWLMREDVLLKSMQNFAYHLKERKELEGRTSAEGFFFYGRICLDEILFMEPRGEVET